jgi:hypothetical protein
LTTNERKPILEDESILWPGTKIVVKETKEQAIILHSLRYGETYSVQTPSGNVLTLKKTDMEIMSCE